MKTIILRNQEADGRSVFGIRDRIAHQSNSAVGKQSAIQAAVIIGHADRISFAPGNPIISGIRPIDLSGVGTKQHMNAGIAFPY